MFYEIDYERILQPQEDGYDIQVFNDIKYYNGYKSMSYPSTLPKLGSLTVVLPKNQTQLMYIRDIDFGPIVEFYKKVWPLGYNNIISLVDAYIPNLEPNENYSGQHDGEEFGQSGAWGIMSTLDLHNPATTFANLIHELMHWKLVSIGFGIKANTFFPTTQEFILNHESELCWSIVNSYEDTAQPAVGNKPTNRPVSASLHAYLSFLGVAYTYSQVLKVQRDNHEALYKMKLWGSRFDKCLDELWKVGYFTPKGQRLMIGISKWTTDFFYEAKQIKHIF